MNVVTTCGLTHSAHVSAPGIEPGIAQSIAQSIAPDSAPDSAGSSERCRTPGRHSRGVRRLALLAAFAVAGVGASIGCTTVPLAPIPEPLPETLEWQAAGQSGAFLGLKTVENDSGSLDALFFLPGARVSRVIENSPASAAGVRAGDIVLALDTQAVNDPAALEALVARRGPGAGIVLSVQRGDTVFDVPVTLAAMGGGGAAAEPAEPRFRLDPSRTRAGWVTTPQGVLLASVAPDAPVSAAGLQVGDVVIALDGESVVSDREFIRRLVALAPGTTVRFTVRNTPADAIQADAIQADAIQTGAIQAGAPPGDGTREVEVTLQDQPTRVTGLNVPLLFSYDAAPDGTRTNLEVIDLWVICLFQFEREEQERHYTLLNLFGWHVFSFSSGEGELGA